MVRTEEKLGFPLKGLKMCVAPAARPARVRVVLEEERT